MCRAEGAVDPRVKRGFLRLEHGRTCTVAPAKRGSQFLPPQPCCGPEPPPTPDCFLQSSGWGWGHVEGSPPTGPKTEPTSASDGEPGGRHHLAGSAFCLQARREGTAAVAPAPSKPGPWSGALRSWDLAEAAAEGGGVGLAATGPAPAPFRNGGARGLAGGGGASLRKVTSRPLPAV